ncbi:MULTISPECIES: hypothetical protein [unclassified Bifidobacterium]|uniref:hypothetical protein n=1 Tax=unclassified Bifidobacterium TaxID=2608897 RepID=UPI001126A44D|nr:MULTISPECIES: hypothetical protein [unclassified Bifidobacterium]
MIDLLDGEPAALALSDEDERAERLDAANRAERRRVCERMVAMRLEAGVDLDEMNRRTELSVSALWSPEHGDAEGLFDLLPDYCTALGMTFEITIQDADRTGALHSSLIGEMP